MIMSTDRGYLTGIMINHLMALHGLCVGPHV